MADHREEITVRDAVAGDLEAIISLYCRKEYFPSPVRAHAEEEHRAYAVRMMRERGHFLGNDPDLRVFMAISGGEPAGYLMVLLNLVETITGERQALLYDYAFSDAGRGRDMMELLYGRALEVIKERGVPYAIVEVAPADRKGLELFESMGFRMEMHRIIKKAERLVITVPDPDPFVVRKAVQGDLMFVILLNQSCGSFTIPPGRDMPRGEIMVRYMKAYMELKLDENDLFTAFIIEDRAAEKPIGYLMYKLNACDSMTGDRIGYIYDLAIDPAYWGKRATQRIMREGERSLAERDITYLVGDISHDNQRALKTAVKSLHFTEESVRWAARVPM
ncbi:MAG: GNAT family N-acetyltransferase [Candidatus Eremiobacteraeota bacterium]|nr:GNAT family N-acetyltransferase [Candidatus Eremiobacteraeota bacterium]